MHRCDTCALPLPGSADCPNFWCGRQDRGFDLVWAIGAHEGELRRAIAGLKYRDEPWRAAALGSLLSRWLLQHAPCFDDVDLIVGVPGTPGRNHTERILAAAAPHIADLWPLDTSHPVLAKIDATHAMVGTGSAALRRLWAAGELRRALVVTDPAAVGNRRVLAFDDVFTDGSTLREVALSLRRAGATSVSGLVLARQALHDLPRTARGPADGQKRW